MFDFVYLNDNFLLRWGRIKKVSGCPKKPCIVNNIPLHISRFSYFALFAFFYFLPEQEATRQKQSRKLNALCLFTECKYFICGFILWSFPTFYLCQFLSLLFGMMFYSLLVALLLHIALCHCTTIVIKF